MALPTEKKLYKDHEGIWGMIGTHSLILTDEFAIVHIDKAQGERLRKSTSRMGVLPIPRELEDAVLELSEQIKKERNT